MKGGIINIKGTNLDCTISLGSLNKRLAISQSIIDETEPLLRQAAMPTESPTSTSGCLGNRLDGGGTRPTLSYLGRGRHV